MCPLLPLCDTHRYTYRYTTSLYACLPQCSVQFCGLVLLIASIACHTAAFCLCAESVRQPLCLRVFCSAALKSLALCCLMRIACHVLACIGFVYAVQRPALWPCAASCVLHTTYTLPAYTRMFVMYATYWHVSAFYTQSCLCIRSAASGPVALLTYVSFVVSPSLRFYY